MKKSIVLLSAAMLSAAVVLPTTQTAQAAAIRPGFEATTIAPNDDGSDGPVNLGFDLDFFGVTTDSVFVNTNGNITLDSGLSTFTPFNLTSTNQQIIAPFFADVDTRNGLNQVTYGFNTIGGQDAFAVNWIDVGYFSAFTPQTSTNSFQLVLIDRSDLGICNFDIEFNYDQIQWEAGEASGSDASGLGGSSARAGYSNGTGAPGTSFELTGSAVNGAFLDNGPASTSLIQNSLNSDVDGRYVFFARNGTIVAGVPEPTSVLSFLALGTAFVLRKRSVDKVA